MFFFLVSLVSILYLVVNRMSLSLLLALFPYVQIDISVCSSVPLYSPWCLALYMIFACFVVVFFFFMFFFWTLLFLFTSPRPSSWIDHTNTQGMVDGLHSTSQREAATCEFYPLPQPVFPSWKTNPSTHWLFPLPFCLISITLPLSTLPFLLSHRLHVFMTPTSLPRSSETFLCAKNPWGSCSLTKRCLLHDIFAWRFLWVVLCGSSLWVNIGRHQRIKCARTSRGQNASEKMWPAQKTTSVGFWFAFLLSCSPDIYGPFDATWRQPSPKPVNHDRDQHGPISSSTAKMCTDSAQHSVCQSGSGASVTAYGTDVVHKIGDGGGDPPIVLKLSEGSLEASSTGGVNPAVNPRVLGALGAGGVTAVFVKRPPWSEWAARIEFPPFVFQWWAVDDGWRWSSAVHVRAICSKAKRIPRETWGHEAETRGRGAHIRNVKRCEQMATPSFKALFTLKTMSQLSLVRRLGSTHSLSQV